MVARIPTLSGALLLGLIAGSATAGTRYVNVAQTTGANDGTSWADAFQGVTGVQSALAVSVAGDDIWVAQGNYKPTAGTSRTISFVLLNGVALYGGFVGTETALDQRDCVAHETLLNADLNGDDGQWGIYTDNSFHVIDATGADATAVLDGFTIRGGNAHFPPTSYATVGGGILCVNGASPTVRNCVFRQNRGDAGAAGVADASSPTFLDCRFESNIAEYDGAGLAIFNNASPVVRRCVFTSNLCGSTGSAVVISASNPTLTNCLIRNNTASAMGWGGAISIFSATPVISQCTIVGNQSPNFVTGGVVANAPVTLGNNIIYFNEGSQGASGTVLNNVWGVSCTYSCVQGIGSGSGNISADPLFVNLATGDLHLSVVSPCADAGDNSGVPAGTTTDLDGNSRFVDDSAVPDTGAGTAPIVDMGAYEVHQLYSSFCAGDGSLATPCPCGNNGAAGRGCRNSNQQSSGALLTVSGTWSPDTVVLTASDMLPSVSCIFLQGSQQNPNGFLFGDGVRCVAVSLKRLYLKTASGGTASAPGPGDLPISARSAFLGDPIAPGSQRFYQVYYRDPDPLFCPTPIGDGWNVTNGAIVNW